MTPLGDMIASNGPRCALARNYPGSSSSRYVFFPGCQLSALAPELVRKVYGTLCRMKPEVGLILRCCGMPAKWAGQPELFEGGRAKLEAIWRGMGKPIVIAACPTCFSMFKNDLPEAEITSLWEVLADDPSRVACPATAGRAAIHDSCTVRNEPRIHDSTRRLAQSLGWETEELPRNREQTVCCGNRGLLAFTAPEAAARVARLRIGESAADYMTYCITCQAAFASQGKTAYYLLDLVFADANNPPPVRKLPEPGCRGENRTRLRKQLLEEVWKENDGSIS